MQKKKFRITLDVALRKSKKDELPEVEYLEGLVEHEFAPNLEDGELVSVSVKEKK